MNLTDYHNQRRQRELAQAQFRDRCLRCRKPPLTCFCELIQSFDSEPRFVILIHKRESRRTLATGRMTHLCIANSELIEGLEFNDHPRVNALIDDPANHCSLLYLHRTSSNISDPQTRRAYFPPGKRHVIFVVDGTWHEAKRMRRESKNLHALPMVCFTPPRRSGFKIRKQPKQNCFSTIEAVHHLIELLGPPPDGRHENLLEVFDYMVNLQLTFDTGRVRGVRKSASLPAGGTD